MFLRTPPEEGRVLAQLLKTDIEIDGFITTPKGFQRGIDENSEPPSYIDILYRTREILTNEERQTAGVLVWEHLIRLCAQALIFERQKENPEMLIWDAPRSPVNWQLMKKVIEYLLWLGYSSAEIEEKLSAINEYFVSKVVKDIMDVQE